MMGFFCTLVFLLFFFAHPVGAEEYTFSADGLDSIEGAWEGITAALPEDVQEALAGFSLTDPDAAVETVQNQLDISGWLGRIWESITDAVPDVLPAFVPLLAMILLTAAANAVLPESPLLKRTFAEYVNLFTAVEVFSMTVTVTAMTQTFLERLCGLMNMLLPVMEAVCLLGGQLTEKAVTGGGLLLLLTLIGNCSEVVLAPLTTLLITLSVVTMTCPEVKLGGMVGALRKWIQRLWAIMGMLFSFLLGMQTVLAKAADSLASRTARFALGSFIPVAGGILAEAFSTIKEGMTFVRQAAGVGGILVIFAILLPGIVPLFLYKFALSLTASAAELLGVSQTAGLLSEIRGIVEFLLGVVLMTALLFTLAIILFAKST